MGLIHTLLYFPWITVTLLILIALPFFLRCLPTKPTTNNKSTKKISPPQAAGGWPLLGHFFKVSGPEPLHISLSNLAEKHGPIFTIQLGACRALIVNSCETAKECYKVNDVAFSNRPKTTAVGLMGYDFAMLGFSNYGPYWREMRKISVMRLLSNRKVAALGNMVENQIQAMMRRMNEFYYSRVGNEAEMVAVPDMRKFFGDLTVSLMAGTVAGNVEKEMDGEKMDNWRNVIREFFKMMNVITVSDVLPAFKWMDYFLGTHRAFRETGKNFDTMLEAWLLEHKNHKTKFVEEEADFMCELLDVADTVSEEFPFYDADTINKATCQTMMLGGVDTMTVTLTWALCLLLNNRPSLIRAQEEVDRQIGRRRLVKESDLGKLPYIKAIIKETLRLQPAVPVNPRATGEDSTVAGYHIPAGTMVFINAWKIQRDPRVWADPLEFRPERFLTSHKDVDVQGLHFELVPFGGGRRVCPGISFAMKTTELALASFVHGFDMETPSGEGVDMTGSFGSTNLKATPLVVCLRPRLPPQLYAL